MRIRQIVFVAAAPESLVEDLCAVLGTGVGFNDPGVAEFGLRNAVLPVGDQFVEVVSPVTETATAKRYLERRKGDGGYMLILQMDDLDGDEKRLADLGVRVVWRADLPEIRGRHLHPKDTGGTLLSLDQPRVVAEWPWGGPRWRAVPQSGAVRRITAAEMQAEDPEPLARRWGEILARRVDRANGAFVIRLDDGDLRFVVAGDGRGEGLGGFDVEVTRRDEVLETARRRGVQVEGSALAIGGMRLRLV